MDIFVPDVSKLLQSLHLDSTEELYQILRINTGHLPVF